MDLPLPIAEVRLHRTHNSLRYEKYLRHKLCLNELSIHL